MSELVSALTAYLDAGDYASLSVAVFVGTLGAVFFALMWFRIFRWVFSLFGLRA